MKKILFVKSHTICLTPHKTVVHTQWGSVVSVWLGQVYFRDAKQVSLTFHYIASLLKQVHSICMRNTH